MATQATIRARIDALETALASGAKSVTVDGVVTTMDLGEMRKELRRLERQLPESKYKRPLAYRVKLG